jgi:hypothetical protein
LSWSGKVLGMTLVSPGKSSDAQCDLKGAWHRKQTSTTDVWAFMASQCPYLPSDTLDILKLLLQEVYY